MSAEQLEFNVDRIDAKMEELLASFEAHPQMQPPNTHPTIFFLFDFIRNAHRELQGIDMDKFRAGDANARRMAQDVLGRNNFTNALVNDTTGKLALMTGGDPNNPVDFGEDIREKAKAINRNQLQALLPWTLAPASSTSNIARRSAALATPESIHCLEGRTRRFIRHLGIIMASEARADVVRYRQEEEPVIVRVVFPG
ncbi:hypothetical protein KXX47_009769 [Aspergillus fumigatus]|nr:hypothetical protein KXX47_009769 [Aspergillus fumigatus]